MRKPEGWETTQPQGRRGFERPKAGAYICRIVKAEERLSKAGNQMLVLNLDIAEGKFADYYQKRYNENSISSPATVRWGCTLFQLTEGNHLPYFKEFIRVLEMENAPWTFDFDERKLSGKRIGMMFVEEEYINNNSEVKTAVRPSYALPIADIISQNYTVPKTKRAKLPQDFSNEEVPF